MQYLSKYYFLVICIFLCTINTNGQQCVYGQSFTIAPAGPYEPGDVVEVTYNLNYFDQVNANWIIAIQVNLGNGWEGLTPTLYPIVSAPPGNWIWDNQNTFPSGLNFGPGWRFINYYGFNPDWGSYSNGPFSVGFEVTVSETCTADDLSIGIEVLGDCLTGGWYNGDCCNDPEFSIYNGVVNVNNYTPSAGSSNSITICSSSDAINLFDQLGGVPDVNGTWSPLLSGGYFGVFDPAINAVNDFSYTVSNECGTSSATINVHLFEPTFNTTTMVELCSDGISIDLYGEIGVNNPNGEWSGVGPLYESPAPDYFGLFNPQEQLAGIYNYTVYDANGCEIVYPVDVSLINSQANAGIDGVVEICQDDDSINLFDYLSGNPDQNGSWNPSLNGGYLGQFNPLSNVSGNYTYIVQDECGADDSEVLINITTVNPPSIILD